MEDKAHTKLSFFYLFIVLLLMLVLPLVSTCIEICIDREKLLSIALLGKWFLFWAVGIRLFTAGIKQAVNPSFTAKNIFHLDDKKSFVLVKELGFANICLGTMGALSLFIPQSRIVAAVAGGLFFGIAGINHILKKPAGANEWIALVSDMFIFILMLFYSVSLVLL